MTENRNTKGSENQTHNRKAAHKRGFMRRLGASMPRGMSKAFKRAGFAESSVIANWRQIAGEELAEYSIPTRLFFKRGERQGGTLQVMVEGAFALQMQHMAPMLVEKINMFHGFRAVERIALVQGPVESRRKRKKQPMPQLGPNDQAKLDKLLGKTHDEGLKGALSRLGQRVFGDDQS